MEGVVAGALQSEREEKTRDRAERGSAVRGFDQASVAPEMTPSRLTGAAIPNPSKRNTKKSARGGTRTHDLRLRRPTLYPTELRALVRFIVTRERGRGKQLSREIAT